MRADLDLVLEWFEENYMVLNGDKCYFLCLGKDVENETFIFNDFILNNSNEEKILRTSIDNKLTFKSHIKILCRKAVQKIGALSRVLNHLSDFQNYHYKTANFLNTNLLLQPSNALGPVYLND